ncbi:MAG: PDDEXK nuclease domain-containing protein [Clostridiales bacterium]|nr:PDDEXK nuclease domain-containing protein [Clostridiales bacterium]
MDNKPTAATFFDNVAKIIENARSFVGRTTNLTMCITYYEVGRMIVKEEQGGEARAEYGKGLLVKLSAYLIERVGKGFSVSTLTNARKFYSVYSPSISQAMLTKSENGEFSQNQKSQAMLTKLANGEFGQIKQSMLIESYPFTLSWSHYLILMRIKNDDERRFYEIEAARQHWDYRYLGRQYGSSLYERLALSREKDEVMKLAKEGQVLENPRDILKNPLALDFLDLDESFGYSEGDLEAAIISKLQDFLLELGKGFLFEAKQKRFTFNEKHFWVDLVTYNRLLKCYVLIDLKTDMLEHRDLGQMQMYVHYFDRHVKLPDEKPTVGILLCKEKDDAVVELTLPEGENIYASEYSLYLPDKSLLQRKLAEWIEEYEEEREMRKLTEGCDDE